MRHFFKINFIILFFAQFAFSQSSSVFDANSFKKDNMEPPFQIGKGFDISDPYKQTRQCFTTETRNIQNLVRQQASFTTKINLYSTKTQQEFNSLRSTGFSGKVTYMNLFSLGADALTKMTKISNDNVERLIFVAKVDFGRFDLPTDPTLTPEAKLLIDSKNFKDFISFYGSHYITGIRKEANIMVIISKTTKTDKSSFESDLKIEAGGTYGGFGGSFEDTDKKTLSEFFSNEDLQIDIEINGPPINKSDLENQLNGILQGGTADKIASIQSIVQGALSNISDPNTGFISQYYFAPFNLYGVNNIIWNAKKENELIKINQNVLKTYSSKSKVEELLSPTFSDETLKFFDDLLSAINPAYSQEIRNSYNQLTVKLKTLKNEYESIIKEFELRYQKCSNIECNPAINCCINSDVETKLNDLNKRVQTELDKFDVVLENAFNNATEEYNSVPDCERNQYGILTIENQSSNPYNLYNGDNLLITLKGKQTTEVQIPVGTNYLRAVQVSGYFSTPTINQRTVIVEIPCQTFETSVGYEE